MPDQASNQRTASQKDTTFSGRPVKIGDAFRAKRLDTPIDRLARKQPGKRSFTRTDRKRGRYIKARPALQKPTDIAFDATIRTAAPFQLHRAELRAERDVAFAVARQDIQQKVRVRRASNLVLFVVDASWSMAASERMEATKGAILSLLMDAYQRRDQVGLIVFQKDRSRLVLPPTSSVDLAERALRDIPVGGKTPLSSGLLLAYEVCLAARQRNAEVMPLIILLTDGAGNVSITGMPPQEEAMRMAGLIKGSNLRAVVINMEHVAFDRGLAQSLADAMGAPCFCLPDLHAEALVATVKDRLNAAKS